MVTEVFAVLPFRQSSSVTQEHILPQTAPDSGILLKSMKVESPVQPLGVPKLQPSFSSTQTIDVLGFFL